jgi:hypothetical protein
MGNDALRAGDNAVRAEVCPTGNCQFHSIMSGQLPSTRVEAGTIPRAFGPAPMFTAAEVQPVTIPSTWSKAPTDVLPTVPKDVAHVSDVKAGEGPRIVVAPFNAEKPPDILVDGKGISYREGFDANQKTISIGYTADATVDNLKAATLVAGEMQASFIKEGQTAPVVVDESHKLPKEFEKEFNDAVKPYLPKPKPDGKDGKDDQEADLNPKPNNGGDTKPGPCPKPNPEDDQIRPPKPEPEDVDSVVTNKDAASRTKEFVSKFGETLIKNGGMHPRVFGHFLQSILNPKILGLMKKLAEDPDNADLQSELAAAVKDSAPEISAALDKQAGKCTDPADKAALGEFKKLLLGDDLKTPNKDFLKSMAGFMKKCDSGESMTGTDTAQLFTNPAVRKAITDLALFNQASNDKLLDPKLPTNPAERKKAVEDFKAAVEKLLIKLQTKPEEVKDTAFKP